MYAQKKHEPMHTLEGMFREGDHQWDVSGGETRAPLREWLAEVWAVEQVVFQNLL